MKKVLAVVVALVIVGLGAWIVLPTNDQPVADVPTQVNHIQEQETSGDFDSPVLNSTLSAVATDITSDLSK